MISTSKGKLLCLDWNFLLEVMGLNLDSTLVTVTAHNETQGELELRGLVLLGGNGVSDITHVLA
jgi:hypothetical protein